MFDDRQRPDLTAVGNVDGQWTRRAAYPPAPQGSIVARTDDQWRAGVLDGLLVAAGMPPAVALAAATMTARDALGLPARRGEVVTFTTTRAWTRPRCAGRSPCSRRGGASCSRDACQLKAGNKGGGRVASCHRERMASTTSVNQATSSGNNPALVAASMATSR